MTCHWEKCFDKIFIVLVMACKYFETMNGQQVLKNLLRKAPKMLKQNFEPLSPV